MAGGNPLEIYTIAGIKLPRYKVVLGMIGIYAGAITTLVTMSSLKEKKILFESKEQEGYVKKYVEHAKIEAHKPVLLRTPFQM